MVSGGWGDHEEKISSVEVMNTDSKQWYAGPPSPVAWRNMKTADMCYFVGGYTGRGSIQCVLSSNGLTGSTPVKYTNNLAHGGKYPDCRLPVPLHFHLVGPCLLLEERIKVTML